MNNPSSHSSLQRLRHSAGYTLVEVVLVVAIISVLSASAFLVVTNTRRSTTNTKLARDVATVNQAIQMYRTSGGTLVGITDPQEVIDQLKKTGKKEFINSKTTYGRAMAGLRKGMVDPRLAVVLQTSVEATSDDERAYYHTDSKTFYISSAGGQGIKEFVFDDSLALKDYGADDRVSSFDLAKTDPWVWDYVNKPFPAKGPPPSSTHLPPGSTGGTPSIPPGARGATCSSSSGSSPSIGTGCWVIG